jgi:hypothetical protein
MSGLQTNGNVRSATPGFPGRTHPPSGVWIQIVVLYQAHYLTSSTRTWWYGWQNMGRAIFCLHLLCKTIPSYKSADLWEPRARLCSGQQMPSNEVTHRSLCQMRFISVLFQYCFITPENWNTKIQLHMIRIVQFLNQQVKCHSLKPMFTGL